MRHVAIFMFHSLFNNIAENWLIDCLLNVSAKLMSRLPVSRLNMVWT